jgi:hypothetical protein
MSMLRVSAAAAVSLPEERDGPVDRISASGAVEA